MDPMTAISAIGLIGLPILGWFIKQANDRSVQTNAAQDVRLAALEADSKAAANLYQTKTDAIRESQRQESELRNFKTDVKVDLDRIYDAINTTKTDLLHAIDAQRHN